MPTYDYECQTCGHAFEELQKMNAAPLTTCFKCKEESLKRKIGGGSGLQFAGSGFYCTDYSQEKQAPATSSQCCPCGKNTSCSS